MAEPSANLAFDLGGTVRRLTRIMLVVLIVGSTTVIGAGAAVAVPHGPAAVDFGPVTLGSTVTKDFLVTLDAGYAITSVSGGFQGPFSFNADACGAGGGFVGPGTCNAKETFTPTEALGTSVTVDLTECPVAGGACVVASLLMVGEGVLALAASPTTLDFGTVGINTSVTREVQVTVDAGYGLVTADGPTFISTPWSFDAYTCTDFEGPGTCTIKVTFFSSSDYIANLIDLALSECPLHTTGACPETHVLVSASALHMFGASPTTLDFGTVGINTSVTREVQVTVDAGYGLVTAEGSTFINAPWSFDPYTCHDFVGPGTCTIRETFVSSSDYIANLLDLVLSECPLLTVGTCPKTHVQVSASALHMFGASTSTVDFGNVPVGQTVTKNVTFTVDAGYRFFTTTFGPGTVAPFSYDYDTCATFVGPGTCNVKLRFAPTTATAASGRFDGNECPVGGGFCPKVTVTLQGTGISSAQTITFAAPANKTVGSAPFAVSASASSGLPVSFASLTSNVCTVSGSTVTLLGTGVCTVRASQAGNATWLAAAPVDRSFSVGVIVNWLLPGNLSIRRGLPIPVAFSLVDAKNKPISDALAKSASLQVSFNGGPPVKATYVSLLKTFGAVVPTSQALAPGSYPLIVTSNSPALPISTTTPMVKIVK